MDEKLFLHINYTADDYLRASVFMRDRMFLQRYGLPLTFASFFLAVVIFVLGLSNDRSTINYPALGIIAFSLSFLITAAVFLLDKYVFPFLRRHGIKEQIKLSPTLNSENEIYFSDEGMEISNELSSSKYKWGAFLKAVESDSDFYFYTTSKTSVFIPKTAFVSEADISFLRGLSKVKLNDKAQF